MLLVLQRCFNHVQMPCLINLESLQGQVVGLSNVELVSWLQPFNKKTRDHLHANEELRRVGILPMQLDDQNMRASSFSKV